MKLSRTGNTPVSFMRQVLHNNLLLLTVLLGIGAAIYFGVGLFMLLRY